MVVNYNEQKTINTKDLKYINMTNKYFEYQQLKYDFERLSHQLNFLNSIKLNKSNYNNEELYKLDIKRLEESIFVLENEYKNFFNYIVENYKECNEYIDNIINCKKKLVLK